MNLTVAIVATLLLAAPDESPRDAAGWRAQSDSLYAQGDYRAALDAAARARELDRRDPWARYVWVRALAAVDADQARAALPGLLDPAGYQAMTAEDRARIDLALGYLCLDLGVEPLAAMHFSAVAPATPSFPQSQAGLAILSVRRGHSRQALVYFVAARVSGKLEPPLAELERETRYQVVLHEFVTARDLRDANAASRSYAVLDELRPSHPATLRARADLAQLRGDAPAHERALRDLLAVDRKAAGAAAELIDTLLEQQRPYDALLVARDLAPERLAGDSALQSIERAWVSHFDAVLGGRWREGETPHDQLVAPELELSWSGSHSRLGRFRIAAYGVQPESDDIPAGEPFGSLVALSAAVGSQEDSGVAAITQWAPRTGFLLELGHTPTSFEISNITAALRFRVQSAEGPVSFGIERVPVDDSLLSYAGTIDPVTGVDWGAVTRNRAYLGGDFGGHHLNVYGTVAGAVLEGHRVDDNVQWTAEAGFWLSAAAGRGWQARYGGNLKAEGFADNRSHFTLGHGGYFSPRRYFAVGPAFELRGRRDSASFRLEGVLAWQKMREEVSEFFPSDSVLQAASGDPQYPSDSREGLGAKLSALVEWRVSDRAIAGVRLEGVRGEDFDEVRLQVYTRRWDRNVTEPLRDLPASLLTPGSYELN